jgi:hypothetical protein
MNTKHNDVLQVPQLRSIDSEGLLYIAYIVSTGYERH